MSSIVVMMTLALAASACSQDQDRTDVRQLGEARAAQTRGLVDELVSRLDGVGVKVTQDATDPCDLGVAS